MRQQPNLRSLSFLALIGSLLLCMPLGHIYSYAAAAVAAIKTNELKAATASEPQQAKNAILFIGDGMGSAAVTATRAWLLGPTGQLAMDRLPVSGFLRTSSSSHLVTDSAAAATAMATGHKTFNGAIAVSDPAYDRSGKSHDLQSILELAHAAGKTVGIVTTARVTHATPAAFYAHTKDRGDEVSIASQIGSSQLDLLMGGGRAYFYPSTWRDRDEQQKPGRRQDQRNIIAELSKQGWHYISRAADLIPPRATDKHPKVLALLSHSHLPFEDPERLTGQGEPLISRMVRFAIETLGPNPAGFLLIVEGGRIDHAAHANKARKVLVEVAAFDHSITTARRLCSPQSTLIVVTADHETGGLALSGQLPLRLARGEALLQSAEGEDARRLLSFATGPGYRHDIGDEQGSASSAYEAAYFLPLAAHTAVDVPLYAVGPQAALFTGSLDNTQIAPRLASALGLRWDENLRGP
jgi:alkaline phosphatase